MSDKRHSGTGSKSGQSKRKTSAVSASTTLRSSHVPGGSTLKPFHRSSALPGNRSSHSSKASRAVGTGGLLPNELKVIDEDGKDRTPKPFILPATIQRQETTGIQTTADNGSQAISVKQDTGKPAPGRQEPGDLTESLWQLEAATVHDAAHTKMEQHCGLGTPGPSQGKLEIMWHWASGFGNGVVATCLCLLPDGRVALGYGRSSVADRPRLGRLSLFSLQNPHNPSLHLKTRAGVSALACSSGNLLAIGLQNGTLQVLDTVPGKELAEESRAHCGPIWDMRWHEADVQQPILLTAGADGRLCQWRCSEVLEQLTLLQLPQGPLGGHVGILSVGLLFQGGEWVIGGEDGSLHEAGKRHARLHHGPIYRLQESPYLPGTLLTASEDGSTKLYSHSKGSVLLSLETDGDAVQDAAWSPWNSTQLITGTRDGRVQLWNLEASLTAPVATISLQGESSITQLCCSSTIPLVLVCHGDGCSVLQLPKAMPHAAHSAEGASEQMHLLQKCLTGGTNKNAES